MARFGYIGNTDDDWFEFLAGQKNLDEVNFWRPGRPQQFKAIEPGAPFLLRRKAPHRMIAGFGFFTRAPMVSIGAAWDAFGTKNGVDSLQDFLRAITRTRGKFSGGAAARPSDSITCLMLANPTFFPPDMWIKSPDHWADAIVGGARLDLDSPEGMRIWEACILRKLEMGEAEPRPEMSILGAEFGKPTVAVPRLGQSGFRLALEDAYGTACAVTNEHSRPVLEAAHIRPHKHDGASIVPNGLLLRADIHRLFDAGYVTVTADYEFEVSKRLQQDFANGKVYYAMQGQAVRLPEKKQDWPRKEALLWHNENVFERMA